MNAPSSQVIFTIKDNGFGHIYLGKIVIEILDSRILFNSHNLLLMEFATHKPSIKALNKADLSDPEPVKKWQDHLEKNDNIKTIALSAKEPDSLKKILD